MSGSTEEREVLSKMKLVILLWWLIK